MGFPIGDNVFHALMAKSGLFSMACAGALLPHESTWIIETSIAFLTPWIFFFYYYEKDERLSLDRQAEGYDINRTVMPGTAGFNRVRISLKMSKDACWLSTTGLFWVNPDMGVVIT